MKMTALRAFPYAGQQLARGDAFEVAARDVRMLEATGYAEPYRETQVIGMQTLPPKRSPVAARPAGARIRARA